jgi:hypothetical protein
MTSLVMHCIPQARAMPSEAAKDPRRLRSRHQATPRVSHGLSEWVRNTVGNL